MSTEVSGMKKWVEVAFEKYGHHAFGLAMFLILWFTVVKPQMDQNKIDYEKQLQLAEFNNEQARMLKATAEIMERTVDKLGR